VDLGQCLTRVTHFSVTCLYPRRKGMEAVNHLSGVGLGMASGQGFWKSSGLKS
jgi:hypothetical protein